VRDRRHAEVTGRARKCVAASCALAFLLCGAAPSRAKSDDLARGVRAYEQGDLERAEPALERASAHAETKIERARAFLTLGLVDAGRTRPKKARLRFERALALDPDVDLERDRVSPAIISLFDEVRRAILGELLVEASEAGARVYVDDEARGEAPLRLRLEKGVHVVRVVSADNERRFDATRVAIGERPMRLFAKLELRKTEPAPRPPWKQLRKKWATASSREHARVY